MLKINKLYADPEAFETMHMGLDIETSHNIVKLYRPGKQYVSPDQIIHERNIMTIQIADLSTMKTAKDVKILLWDQKQWQKDATGDRKILTEFSKQCNKYQRIKVYTKNGKRFDWPYINGRLAVLGLKPLPPVTEIDVEEMVRKTMNFNGYGLDYLARLFGISSGKIRMERQDWWDMEDGVGKVLERAIKKFFRYGAKDVVDTWKLYKRVAPYVPQVRTYTSIRINNGMCPHCLKRGMKNKMHKRGQVEVLSGWKQRWHCDAKKHPKDARRWFTETRVQRDY